ncbi:ABC transporter substrate-binding protein [Microtetraspora sp. NBRC 13810]|uniref:ABC transporter substrate-binding protein n=1 Tax=Microtetraspora sp. NBRC 13810 TaxID=3030990 RepID=UPI0025530F3F|nr:ABC transporter substrate-binding protein [Microtetraspora sp. NBRC 13810]
MSRRHALGLFGAVGVSGLLAACGGGGDGTDTAAGGGGGGGKRVGGDLKIVRSQDAVSMNNTMVFSNASIWVFQQIFETLYTNAPDGKSVKPWLAESYTTSDDKLTWTFKLRSGVLFSNGQPVTAEDVKFSLDKAGSTKGGWEFINSAIDKVTAPDASTVVITTKYPWAPLLADLACPNNGIVPKNYGGRSADDFYNAPVGTGPFMWGSWSKGSSLTLKKNPHYWQQGKPAVDSVTWQVVPDDNTRNLMVQGGQADINENPPFSTLDQLRSSGTVKVDVFPSTRTDYVMMNNTKKPYDDIHVRRAISYAIDRNALVKSVLFGNGKAANSVFMPTVPYYDANTPGLQFDMAKAKAELAQSSVPNGFTTTYLASSGDSTDAAIAQIMQASLKQLGITMNIQNTDPSAVHDLQTKLNFEITHSYWTMDIADPDELAQYALDPTTGGHSFNTGYDDKATIDLVHKAQKTFDTTARQQLYSEIQTKAAESAYMAFLYYQPFPYATRSGVAGFQVLPTGSYHLENVYFTA